MEYKVDLMHDWVEQMKQEMINVGLNITNLSTEKVPYGYFNYKRCLIKAKPRQVIRSDVFFCPQDWNKGLAKLIHKIENGSDLKPHLKLKVNNDEDNIDFFLNDWGVYSLHLKKRISNEAEEKGPVVFAYFTDTIAYFIGCFPEEEWSAKNILEVMDRNWPALIESYKITGIMGESAPMSNDEMCSLRKQNKNLIITMKTGVAYCSVGRTYDGEGNCLKVVKEVEQIKARLQHLEEELHKDIDKIESKVRYAHEDIVDAFEIGLSEDKLGRTILVEKNNRVALAKLHGLFGSF